MRRRSRLMFALCCAIQALATAAETPLQAGQAAYARGDYARAADVLAEAVRRAPADDEAVYWLGKAYGRQAERAGWLEAVKLARKTRDALERAVKLNPDNHDAVRDLADYYDQAPGFLGGDARKAAALRARLANLPAP